MNKWLRWFFVLLWMAVIFAFSAQPHSGAATREYLGDFNVPVRKAAHMTEYAVLFLLSRFAVFGTTDSINFRQWLPIMISIGYACTDEFHQSFVPGRSAQLSDVLVDSSGVFISWAAKVIASKFRGVKQRG